VEEGNREQGRDCPECDFGMAPTFVRNATEMPASMACSSVVSQNSIRIALLAAALNDLDVFAMDATSAHLSADCREKMWTEAGPEFGPEWEGKALIMKKALCGLKSSGAAWRQLLSDVLQHELHFRPSVADPDVCVHSAVKEGVRSTASWSWCTLVAFGAFQLMQSPLLITLQGHLN
jgi:hypothetical protein